MTKRTYENDANIIETAEDLEDIVVDKRVTWRASSSKARRRQRRYKNRLTKELQSSFSINE
tara:strand:- start:1151 stop:1333 length:183 start_codon:yes stop_codon:yes gene_type:complete